MSIGLKTEQLVQVFVDALGKRQSELAVEKMTADMGLNPNLEKIRAGITEQYPDISFDQIALILSIIMASADTIVRNNRELAKVIPHIDQTSL
jgi:hypothetical protein